MATNLFDVSDTVVLVSGGSRGIGLAIAEAFVSQAAKVVITGRNENTLQAACANTRPTPFAMSCQRCDVSSSGAISACVDAVVINPIFKGVFAIRSRCHDPVAC